MNAQVANFGILLITFVKQLKIVVVKYHGGILIRKNVSQLLVVIMLILIWIIILASVLRALIAMQMNHMEILLQSIV
jgi:hypothetical protein